jgi:UTP-glucose-1-phosphate uridylyltransferase
MNPRTKYINSFAGPTSQGWRKSNFTHADSDNIENILGNEKVIIIAEDNILDNLHEIKRDIAKIKEVQAIEMHEINELKKQIISQERHQMHFFNLAKQIEKPTGSAAQNVRKRSCSM